MSSTWEPVSRALAITRPLYLLVGALLFGLGTAVARYVGVPIDGGLAGLGLLAVLSAQACLHFLEGLFALRVDPEGGRVPARGWPFAGEARFPFLASALSLGVLATALTLILQDESVAALPWFFLALAFSLGLAYFHPAIRLATSGYGEVALSSATAALIPAFAFSLQSSDLHPLLFMSSLPLVALHFAMITALELRAYARDVRLSRGTLLVRLGWAPAMRAHDIAILLGLGSIGYAAFNGLPPRVALGCLLVLPLALGQIWQMDRIRRGFPARWRMLSLVARGTFGLTLYLELAGFLLTMA